MTIGELLASFGIDPSVLVAGTGGGILRALSRKKLKVREMILSPLCGALAAAYLTMPFVAFVRSTGWPLPSEDLQAVLAGAFLIGTCAMWIADIAGDMLVRWFKSSGEARP